MKRILVFALGLGLAACSGSTTNDGLGGGGSSSTGGSGGSSGDAGSVPMYDSGTELPDSGGEPADITCPVSGSAANAIHTETPDWDSSSATIVTFADTSATVEGNGATASGAVVTITAAGTYIVSGSTAEGQLVVDGIDASVIEIVLSGAQISNSTTAPIYVKNAYEDVHIYLAEGTTNTVTDGRAGASVAEEPEAAIFSHDDLVIHGPGKLTVNAGYSDGIASKDELFITNGLIEVTAFDDGLRGKDTMGISGGCFIIKANGDGIKATNDTDVGRGNVTVGAGAMQVEAGGDGISAYSTFSATGGRLVLTAGGGSSQSVSSTASAKGIKGNNITIADGSFDINVAEDGVHSDADMTITGGTFAVAANDDGFHAEANMVFDAGDVTVSKSYEGLEAAHITINDGTFHITSSDDGLNCAGGDGSGGPFPASGDYMLYINGGYIAVNANGDGLDSNGSIEISGGTILVNGPTENNNGALDIGDGGGSYCKITGGLLVAAGSSGMAIGPGTTSTQRSVLVNLTSAQQANTIFHVETQAGEEVLTFQPLKKYQSVVFSMPALGTGSHTIYLGGSSTGTLADSLYSGGVYTPGTQYTTFDIQSVTTTVGQSGGPPHP